MAHTFLAIDITKHPLDNSMGILSNDGRYLLIDGRNKKGVLVHSDSLISEQIALSSDELTLEQFKVERQNPESIWYKKETESI